jgi:outer membrane protein, multidrug efflux system
MRSPLFALAALVGCVPSLHGPAAREAALSVPDAYTVPTEAGNAATTAWDDYFGDPQLVALLDEAVQHNQELGIQLQETRISQAEFVARRGEYLPRLGLAAGAGVERVGLYTSQGASDAANEIEPGREVPENLGDLRIGFEASWELDVWKKLRNASKAAQLRYLASVEGRNFAATGVVAEVANGYYELLALDNQLRVVDTNVQILTDSLEIVRLEKEAARVTELAVQRFEAELLKVRARRFVILQEIAAAENRVNFLCGRLPGPIARNPEGFVTLSPGPVRAGTPGDLLENRPDVRQAELLLAASKLDVKSAKAAFYPSFGLDAGVGLDAFSLARLGSLPESLIFDVAGGMFAPLLNRADLKGAYAAADARQLQAVLGYERSVLGAYTDVATQQSKLVNLEQSFALKAQQVATLQEAVETSTGLFRNARADYLEVLTTRRDALESELELIETKQEQLAAKVDLYQALGGGWRELDGATR